MPRERALGRRILGCPSCRAVQTSTSSARAAAQRCLRTSRSAPTAERGSRSARPSSIAAACRRRREARSLAAAAAAAAPGRDPRDPRRPARVGGLGARAGVGARSRSAIKSGLLVDPRTSRSSPASTSPWRAFTTLFAYVVDRLRGGHASGAIALFGWLLERRHGWWAPLFVFFVCGAGGAYVAVEFAGEGIARGANGAALGMLAAWTMRDVLGRRKRPRGRQRPARRAGDRRRARPAAAGHDGRQRDRRRRRRRRRHPARAAARARLPRRR